MLRCAINGRRGKTSEITNEDADSPQPVGKAMGRRNRLFKAFRPTFLFSCLLFVLGDAAVVLSLSLGILAWTRLGSLPEYRISESWFLTVRFPVVKSPFLVCHPPSFYFCCFDDAFFCICAYNVISFLFCFLFTGKKREERRHRQSAIFFSNKDYSFAGISYN